MQIVVMQMVKSSNGWTGEEMVLRTEPEVEAMAGPTT
jgi:hypothetical protein